MAETLTFTGKLTVVSCWCGIRLAVPDSLYRYAKKSPNNHIYCPLGHTFVYRETEADALRAKLDQAEAEARELRWKKEQAEIAAARARAVAEGHRGQLVRTKARLAKGVCPCCNRQFANLARHMAGQHPGYEADPLIHVPESVHPHDNRVLATCADWDKGTIADLARRSRLTYQQARLAVLRLVDAGLVTWQPYGYVRLAK